MKMHVVKNRETGDWEIHERDDYAGKRLMSCHKHGFALWMAQCWAEMTTREGYWACVGDGGEVEARIGPTPVEWFPTHDEALQYVVQRNQEAVRDDVDSFWSTNSDVKIREKWGRR